MAELVTITMTMKVEGDRAKIEEAAVKAREEFAERIGEQDEDGLGILRGFSMVVS